MGYMSDGLTFKVLRRANLRRLPLFKNAQGLTRDHAEWTTMHWLVAVLGELGEAANVIKKVARGDFDLEQARGLIAEELADTVTYLDLLANHVGIDLGNAVLAKFNKVSDRIGCPVKIRGDGTDWYLAPKEHNRG